MLSLLNGLRIFACTFVSVLTAAVSFFTAGLNLCGEPPKTPADFVPVMRFAICSDVHITDGEENLPPDEQRQSEEIKKRLDRLFKVVYKYADSSDTYKGVDAFAFAGDFTNKGLKSQYEAFNRICNDNIREGTQRIACLGNHEFIAYRDKDITEGARVFNEMIGESNTHYKMGGYHFISVSYDSDTEESFVKNSQWLRKQLKEAKKDTGDKPIFVMHHPAPFGTIYGSTNWGDVILPTVLSAYPQVVDFSGHSHYPVNDPRSIWQGTFTALGCGTLDYFETELDLSAGNYPYTETEAAQFYIVEGDAKGNVRILPYDLITNSFFDIEYYLTDLAKRNYPYSYANRMKEDKAPVFENPSFKTELNDQGETLLSFKGAKDNFVTESYKLTVRQGAKKVFDESFSGKYMYLFMDDTYEINLGKLEKGKEYDVALVAMSAYSKKSAAEHYSFVAQ